MSLNGSTRIVWPTHAIADMLSAMGNTRRLQALLHLQKGETTVNDMAEAIGLTQSSLSQHLAVLRRSNLVKTRRRAQTIYYSLDSMPVSKILTLLDEIFAKEQKTPPHEQNYLEHSI
jgi:ArsR family transcriptional regulator, virulence genes transcriptional regulator